MKQQTLTGFEKYGKTTRRAQFLADMDKIVPWPELAAAVQTAYPKVSENGGRPPIPLERMLRIYFLQLWFNLSDPAVEEALYDSAAMRGFVGVDLGAEAAPDETTVCKFRHLLERNKLIHISPARLAWVDGWFQRHGDATVFLARLLPLVRAFISLPAGLAKMPFWRFTWLTALGSLPWVVGFALIGRAVGDNWEQWRHHLQVLDYLVVAAIVALIVYWLVKRRGGGSDDEGTDPAVETAGTGSA